MLHGRWRKRFRPPSAPGKRKPYASIHITWGGKNYKECRWQCKCSKVQDGCQSQGKCVDYSFSTATHLCELFDEERARPPPHAPPKVAITQAPIRVLRDPFDMSRGKTRAPGPRRPYITLRITWGGKNYKECRWQCTCETFQAGCKSEGKCMDYTFNRATHLCELFDAKKQPPSPSASPTAPATHTPFGVEPDVYDVGRSTPAPGPRRPYMTMQITWGGKNYKECRWQCTCKSQQGCKGQGKCVDYRFTRASKLCELFDVKRGLRAATTPTPDIFARVISEPHQCHCRAISAPQAETINVLVVSVPELH